MNRRKFKINWVDECSLAQRPTVPIKRLLIKVLLAMLEWLLSNTLSWLSGVVPPG